MNNLDLPPFPVPGKRGQQTCESVRFYLAIVDELSFEQVRILSEHVKECEGCAAEFRLLQYTTRMIATLPASVPSARVDNAIQAAIKSRQRMGISPVPPHPDTSEPLNSRTPRGKTPVPFHRRHVGALALVAALLLILTAGGVFLRGQILPAGNSQAFRLPANLTWNGYVLHYTQNQDDAQGRSYQVDVYQDLGNNHMHIESTMQGQFDVVVVTDDQNMLGKDMMHHVAQEGSGVENWAIDGSLFDLAHLRQDLAAKRAVYLGQSTFQGKAVYQIRASDNRVLLLNMQYLPINALSDFTGPGTGKPTYTNFALMSSAQVSDSMWDMGIPADFHMGKLPAKS